MLFFSLAGRAQRLVSLPRTSHTRCKPPSSTSLGERASAWRDREQSSHFARATILCGGWLLKEVSQKQLDKKMRSDEMDKVYNKAFKVMRQFAFLADGDPDAVTAEGDLLLEYTAKMTQLQCQRKRLFGNAERVAEMNASFPRLKHKRDC